MRSMDRRHCCFYALLALSSLACESHAFVAPTPSVAAASIAHNSKVTAIVRGGDTSLNLVGTTAATATIASLAMPTAKTILATTLLPTCIGFYKYEYGVSYAYGTATATTAYLIMRSLLTLPQNPFTAVALCHAAAIVFYGTRLNLFLLWRELCLERFRRMRQKIEERQTNKEGDAGIVGRIINRTPFILSCAVLYAGLAGPALMSGKLVEMSTEAAAVVAASSVKVTKKAAAKAVTTASVNTAAASIQCVAFMVYKALVATTWFGFGLGALGDFTKSLSKSRNGPDHLVTGGVYSFFRHPNYTGEVIGWTASFFAAVAAMFCADGVKFQVALKTLALPLLLSISGLFGITFVLCAATTNLEKRQTEKYGETDAYKNWNSWPGFTLKPKAK